MKTLDFPAKKHLTASDRGRLEIKAKEAGQTPEDYVETVLKLALFSNAFPINKKGVKP